jgi:hypothetical protein
LSCNKNRDIEEEELRALELSYSWYTPTVIDYDHGVVHTLITSRGRLAMNGTNYSVKGLHDDPTPPPPLSPPSSIGCKVINGLVFITINGWKPC